ncbi:IclR family transcriptional regulator [Paraburkholderia sp. BR13439]|uniref:IclR family transcriptional regulator n=1 Tax=Paraburkholderia sp. BR13439 TaxID=3236996 RepID=UPI0034CEB77F
MRLLQSLTRGLEALTYLRTHRGPVRLTELASELEMDKSMAAHLLKTLVAAGYAAQDSNRRYLASNGSQQVKPVQRTLEEVVAIKEAWRPALERLAASTGECTHLAVLVGARVWYIDKVDSTLPLKVDHPIGALSPLHCTALGKAFLAFGHAEAPGELVTYTLRTLTSEPALAQELELTRQRGYAIDDEEFTDGIRCVARPIYDAHDEMIAAMGISCPSVRVDAARLAELGDIVLRESGG